MLKLCRSLLCLYPASYREEYSEEMMAVLCDVQAEIRKESAARRAWFEIHEVGGLLCGAIEEHFRAITSSYRRGIFERRFTMRSEFRFPKTTVALMTIILVAIMVIIEKAKAISASLPHTNPAVGPIQPEQFTIVTTFLIIFVAAGVVAAIGWAVLFALRRSGVQRLSAVNPSTTHSTSN
jgi:hypothetical protein